MIFDQSPVSIQTKFKSNFYQTSTKCLEKSLNLASSAQVMLLVPHAIMSKSGIAPFIVALSSVTQLLTPSFMLVLITNGHVSKISKKQ